MLKGLLTYIVLEKNTLLYVPEKTYSKRVNFEEIFISYS